MTEDRRGAAVGARILRRLLDRPWLSVDDIAAHAEISERAARSWARSLEHEGLVKRRISDRRRQGPAPVEFSLSSQWGGL